MNIDRRRPTSILECIGPAAMLEQMAEEAAELSKACLKLARVIRGENPTPVTKDQAVDNVIEEYTDVIQCALELDLEADKGQIREKKMRFFRRWMARKNEWKTLDERGRNVPRRKDRYLYRKEHRKEARPKF